MKENWIQLIDTIEKDPFETEAFFALMEYVGEASDDDKRRVVQEVAVSYTQLRAHET